MRYAQDSRVGRTDSMAVSERWKERGLPSVVVPEGGSTIKSDEIVISPRSTVKNLNCGNCMSAEASSTFPPVFRGKKFLKGMPPLFAQVLAFELTSKLFYRFWIWINVFFANFWPVCFEILVGFDEDLEVFSHDVGVVFGSESFAFSL